MQFFDENIDPKLELRFKLISSPCEKRFEIFERRNIQLFLEKVPAKDLVNLYELFPPEDAYKFFKSSLIQDKLKNEISSSDIDCEDILSYFKDKEIKKAVNSLLGPHSRQPNTLDTNKVIRI